MRSNSPQQSSEARDALAGHDGLTVHCGDVAEVLETMPEAGFDAMVGYFMLHHLPELERYFRGAHRALRPGGRIVFVEPNPFHPLYPVQIACTPGMRWRAERGIYRLTPTGLRRGRRPRASPASTSAVTVRSRARPTTGWRGWVANACRNLSFPRSSSRSRRS